MFRRAGVRRRQRAVPATTATTRRAFVDVRPARDRPADRASTTGWSTACAPSGSACRSSTTSSGRVLDVSPSGIVVLDFDGRIESGQPCRRAAAAAARRRRCADGARRRRACRCSRRIASLEPGEARVIAAHGGRRVRVQRGTFLDRGFPRSFFLLEELTEELRQSEKAAYEKLIRMMSHEVNNSVGASSSLLQSSLSYSAQLVGRRPRRLRARAADRDRSHGAAEPVHAELRGRRAPAAAGASAGGPGRRAAPHRGARARRPRGTRHRVALGRSRRIPPSCRSIPCRSSRRCSTS